jgi:hypothetical protein
MSVAPFAIVAVVAGTVFAVGCARVSSPTSPSSPAAASSVSSSSTQSTSNFAPVLAQLNRVDNFLVDANHQLSLCLAPPALGHPPGPCDQNSLDFYLKANAALDGLAPAYPPGPPSAPAAQPTRCSPPVGASHCPSTRSNGASPTMRSKPSAPARR